MPVKQVTTSVSEEVFKQFEQLCQSRGVTTYQGMKELIEIAIGQDSTFLDGKPEEPKLGMTAREALKATPIPKGPSAREKIEAMLKDNWQRFKQGERQERSGDLG